MAGEGPALAGELVLAFGPPWVKVFVMADRKLPRKFSMPWGDGQVVDEVGVETEHNEVVIQLLRYDELPGATLRFCQYWLDGKFQRQPMMLAEADIERMRDSLRGAPEIRQLLKRLVADD